MIPTISVWCDARYGDSSLERVKVSKAGDSIQFISDSGQVVFYFRDSTGVIDLKNKVLAAFETWDRARKRNKP